MTSFGINVAKSQVVNTTSELYKPIVIGFENQHSAVELAAKELVKYINIMAANPLAAAVINDPTSVIYSQDDNALPINIRLGIFDELGIEVSGIDDPELDDAIYVNVNNSEGIIAGSNPRSVLFATYRFLEANGCKWIRPGPNGDYVPNRRIDDLSFRVTERAKYRFRGDAPDGSFSLDHVLDRIEWGSKVGQNSYYSEFFYPRYPHNDYYGREYPSKKNKEPRSDSEIIAYYELTIQEAKRRGMLVHAVGHGWAAKFFDNPEVASDHRGTLTVPENQKQYLALVGGERVISGPTFTDLCYGNPAVQQRLVAVVADYAENNPEIDFLHFWLDDRLNATCEDEFCRDTRQSDFYVKILNGIDKELSRRGLDTYIVSLIYQDLLWPPEKEILLNSDRFVLLFCPISRLYDKPYEIPVQKIELPSYKLNKNRLPSDIQTNIAFLQEWQRSGFNGMGAVYDYHMTWHHYYDLGYYGMTDVLAEDIRRVGNLLELQGFISCMVLRSFYPHGFPMHVNYKLLWDPAYDLEKLAQEYFEGAFGPEGLKVRDYMKTLSELSCFRLFYRIRRANEEVTEEERIETIRKLDLIPQVVDDFNIVIEKNKRIVVDSAQQTSWHHIAIHSEMVLMYADMLMGWISEDEDRRTKSWEDLFEYISQHEVDTDNVFDIKRFESSLPRPK